jgi:RHS repeat-associated protein
MTKTPSGGNALTTTYHYDEANQIIDVNGVNFSYDVNGNVTSDGKQTYTYDVEDRLTSVKDSNNNTIASFTYDSDGFRKTMTTASGTITYHYDENNNVAYETDSSNAVIASYTFNGSQPISMTRGGQTYSYQYNGHGDVVALTNATGSIVNTYEYDAFGNILKETGNIENPYRYAGYRYDSNTGLYYLQGRYFDSKLGRYLSRDSFEGFDKSPVSLNKYIYVENNPTNKVDPSGHWHGLLDTQSMKQ